MAIIKPSPISGFSEYSPAIQVRAQAILDSIRATFELHGFCPIETPIVERIEVLLSKSGDTDKEMYVLKRLQADDSQEADFGLRYDLTVPFARYVAAHFSELQFPFKRYQIQDCWRGERPQEGRYRQFKQCDVDIVAIDQLPLAFDIEVPLVVMPILRALGLDDFDFRISNRNILDGYLAGLGLKQTQEARRALDKLDKIGADGVADLLSSMGIGASIIDKMLAIGAIKVRDLSFVDQVRALGVEHELLDRGLEDLQYVAQACLQEGHPEFLFDMSVTRGFDYYTGTVYEVTWNTYPELGSVGGGGRYEDLAGNYINKKLPGVGMSIGFTRIFGKLIKDGKIAEPTEGTTKFLVMRMSDEDQLAAQEVAGILRGRGFSTEVYWTADKAKKQFQYANRKQIPYVVFGTEGEVKDLRSGEQQSFDPNTFNPQ
ncbi:MAG: histidine--tRNA ligase [Bdellovibrionales bacterium]|nr:histidine--tRNA ligase [Bdellovibrionales bacterium]